MFKTLKPFISASIALCMATLLALTDFYFDDVPSLWIMVLWALLFTAILVMFGQSIHAEKEIHNHSSQSLANKERLSNEIKHRLWAEKTIAEVKAKSQIIDENIPVLLAYFNTDQRCSYHNRIFRRWFGLKPDQIDGKQLEEFANEEFTSSIKKHIQKVLSGETIHEERILKSTKGFPYIFTEQYIPHMDNTGKAIGFYTLHTPKAQNKVHATPKNNGQTSKPTPEHNRSNTVEKTNNESARSGIMADRIIKALKDGEFNLFCQEIIPLDPNSSIPTHYEILIRMAEEEDNLMPPGSFLPLVDQLKMMPQLDRWVAGYIVRWLVSHPQNNTSIFCLNVARDTLCDEAFIGFIQEKIQQSKIPPQSLCFEIEEIDARSNLAATISFTDKIRKLGCLVTLCSFGQSTAAMDLLKKMKVDYIKIDGGIICNILHDDEDLARAKGIKQIAQKLNIKTIAELVENDETITQLREIGIDYAQGFGITKPCPLEKLNTERNT